MKNRVGVRTLFEHLKERGGLLSEGEDESDIFGLV